MWRGGFAPAIDSEIRKTRPAVVVSNDAANRNLAQVVVPLTRNTGRVYPGKAVVTMRGQRSKTMADQIMAADKARLTNRAGHAFQGRHAGRGRRHQGSFGATAVTLRRLPKMNGSFPPP